MQTAASLYKIVWFGQANSSRDGEGGGGDGEGQDGHREGSGGDGEGRGRGKAGEGDGGGRGAPWSQTQKKPLGVVWVVLTIRLNLR